jgi:ribosomal protein L21E
MEECDRTVEVTDWDAVTAELERFCTDGTLHVESDMASCTAGDATIEIYANGRVQGGMPLHEFDGRVDTLEFDHSAGTITVESEEVRYTFRRP